MIVQHPMLWCAAFLMAGIAVGLQFPLRLWLPLLAVAVVCCTVLRNRSGHLHDVLVLVVWFLLGSSRAAIGPVFEARPEWQQTLDREARHARTFLVERLRTAGLSPRTLALCSALTVGQKDGLKRETRRAYNRVGAGHLLALSGMHLGIIYGFLYSVLIRRVRQSKWRWHALPPILLLLWGYVLVAGMPVSLLRAALMLSGFTVLSLMQYRTDPLHLLALSAVIMMLAAPSDLLSISFQLSFSAVFFLLALWRPLQDRLPALHWTVSLLAVSCVACLGTMPLSAYYFHSVSLVGPLLSIALIPLTSLIIYLSLAAMLLPVEPLGRLLNSLEAVQQDIIDTAGSLPWASLGDIRPSALTVAFIYGVMLVAIVRLRTNPDVA